MTPSNDARGSFALRAASAAILGVVLAAPAIAQPFAPHGYVGANVGRSWADFEYGPWLTVPPATVTAIGSEKNDTVWKLYGGYRFHPNFAVELGYHDLGRYDYFFNSLAGNYNGTSRYNGAHLDLLGIVPVSERLNVFGRVGAAYTRTRTSATTTGLVGGAGDRSDSDIGAKFGVGLEYAFSHNLAVRAEIERYRVNDPVRSRGNIDVASVGLVWRFGAPAPQPVRVVAPPPPPPPPRVIAPAPPPPVAPPPPPPPPPPAPAPLPPRPARN